MGQLIIVPYLKEIGDYMIIDVNNIKDEIVKLNDLLDKYKDNYLNLYNEINNASSYWNDLISVKFFDSCKIEKIETKTTLEEIKSIIDIYNYILEKYQEIGKKIKFEIKNRDIVINGFNNYIIKVDDLIREYNSINFNCNIKISNMLNDQLYKLKNNRKILNNIKDKVKDIFDNIEEIEKEINLRLSKINIDIIKEIDISIFI